MALMRRLRRQSFSQGSMRVWRIPLQTTGAHYLLGAKNGRSLSVWGIEVTDYKGNCWMKDGPGGCTKLTAVALTYVENLCSIIEK